MEKHSVVSLYYPMIFESEAFRRKVEDIAGRRCSSIGFEGTQDYCNSVISFDCTNNPSLSADIFTRLKRHFEHPSIRITCHDFEIIRG